MDRQHRTIMTLTAVAMILTVGTHVDHLIRGNHVGWPVVAEVTPFTYSLGIYPVVLTAVLLDRAGRFGPGSWAFISGTGALFLLALHFGPFATEPPGDIIDGYDGIAGWFWYGWTLALIATLIITCLVEVRFWVRNRAVDDVPQRADRSAATMIGG